MRTALIGHTGFVGSTLARQFSFTDHYNSQNITEIVGKTYDLIVCAAAPGVKWKANQEPMADKASIDHLITQLNQVTAAECVLISTVDVYPVIAGVDETTVIDQSQLQPYGLHRLQLENTLKTLFSKVTICRLPALFGEGLKKNFIYDLIQNQMLEYTHPDSTFQFYNLTHLWSDIQMLRQNSISLMNFVTEPLQAKAIAKAALDLELTPSATAKIVSYDLHTQHAAVLGGTGHYIASASTVLPELVGFIQEHRR